MSEMEHSLRGLLTAFEGMTPELMRLASSWTSPMDLLHLLYKFPGAFDWLRFRAECIVEHVSEIISACMSIQGNLINMLGEQSGTSFTVEIK